MRKIFIVLLCCTVTLMAGYASYRGYKVWKVKNLMGMAREYIAKSDSRNAMLCLQQALRANPQNVEACRMSAQLCEASRSSAALLWRNRVVELNPKSTEDRLALVQTALIFRDIGAATNALEGVAVEGKKTPAYHNLAGAVAAAANRLEEAEAHLVEAARLEPTNPVPRLNLAILRLHGTNTVAMADARVVLERISGDSSNPMLRCEALRELVVDSMQSKQIERASVLSKVLVQQTNSAFSDRLLRLDVLMKADNAEFQQALVNSQNEAVTNNARLYEMAVWEMKKTSPRAAFTWLTSLPQMVRTNQPAALLSAECQVSIQDWSGLQKSLEKQQWADLDLLRHGFLSRSLRGQELTSASKGEWELALKGASGQKPGLILLLNLAAQWNWQSESEEILWTIINQYPGEEWAFQTLSRALFVSGRTRPLMMLCSQKSKRTPSDLEAKNNVAMLALLLDAQELKPHEIAREIYEKSPTNPSYLSTYAFSLYMQNKGVDALRIFEKLSPKDLKDPSIAGYYGLVLKATGDSARAKPYLEEISKAKLLPEERKLFERAKIGV